VEHTGADAALEHAAYRFLNSGKATQGAIGWDGKFYEEGELDNLAQDYVEKHGWPHDNQRINFSKSLSATSQFHQMGEGLLSQVIADIGTGIAATNPYGSRVATARWVESRTMRLLQRAAISPARRSIRAANRCRWSRLARARHAPPVSPRRHASG
jgi:hypothetical protein